MASTQQLQLCARRGNEPATVTPLEKFMPTATSWNAYYFYKDSTNDDIEVRAEPNELEKDSGTHKGALAILRKFQAIETCSHGC